jgi:hypothetical protein
VNTRRALFVLAVMLLPYWVEIPSALADGPEEDSPEWSCVDDGNHVCGPNNPEGKPAACYDDGGVIVAMWPCNPWTPDMGHRHADGTTTYPNGDVLDDNGDDPR